MKPWKKAILLVLGNLAIAITTLAQPVVDVIAIPEKTQVFIGDTLHVVIQIQAGKQPVVGATANLKFDPSLLNVVEMLPSNTLETEIASKFDNDKGHMIYSAGTFSDPLADTFDLITVQFKVIGNTKNATLSFDTSTENPERTDVAYYGATSVLNTTYPATVMIIANTPPVANAGTDVTLIDEDGDGKEKIKLDGSASTDKDGKIESYIWKIGDKIIAQEAVAELDFNKGQTKVTLVVTDNQGAIGKDEVVITINEPDNIAPVANAGEDQTLTDTDGNGKEEVQLDGSASSDEDGEIVSYRWSIGDKEIAVRDTTTVELELGTNIIILTVTDNKGLSSTDDVTITINASANRAPIANAGEDIVVEDINKDGKEEIVLDGSGSIRGSHGIASYSWSTTEGEIATGVQPTINLPVGVTTITLTVTDNKGITSKDEVKVTVLEYTNMDPIANAGEDQELMDEDSDGKEEVVLDGAASKDQDGSIASFDWYNNEGQKIATGETANVNFNVGVSKIYLVVADNRGAQDTASVTISVVEQPLGINETQKELANIVVFPNPSDSYFTISSSTHTSLDFYIMDTRGRIIRKSNTHNGKAIFDLSLYPKGIYYLAIERKGERLTKKLIVR